MVTSVRWQVVSAFPIGALSRIAQPLPHSLCLMLVLGTPVLSLRPDHCRPWLLTIIMALVRRRE